MKTLLLIALSILLILELLAENLPILKSVHPVRMSCGILLAVAGVCYALWVRADVLGWDFPTRLALAGCLFPVLTALEQTLPRYKKILTWILGGVYLILLLLTAFKG